LGAILLAESADRFLRDRIPRESVRGWPRGARRHYLHWFARRQSGQIVIGGSDGMSPPPTS